MRAVIAISILLFGSASAAAECGSDVAALRRLAGDASFPLQWIESGMNDGKPLVLVLREEGGALYMRLDKAREGLWAEGGGSVCVVGGRVEMRFDAGQIRPGPAAHWLLRQSLQAGARFTFMRMGAGGLRVSTPGWSGRFVAGSAPEHL
jgi:hypothetical protein